MTNTIDWNNIETIVATTKQNLNDKFESVQQVYDFQNVFLIALKNELEMLAEAKPSAFARVAINQCEAVWGELYQAEEESDNVKFACELVIAFKDASESGWITLAWLVSVARHVIGFSHYHASKAAEKGNTTALKVAAHYKNILNQFDDLATVIWQVIEN